MTTTQTATLHTSQGTIVIRLFPDHAPETVRNCVDLAQGAREWTDPRTGSTTTGRLYDALAARFGANRVFIDVDTIPLGLDFERVIRDAVSACDVFVAVIEGQGGTQ